MDFPDSQTDREIQRERERGSEKQDDDIELTMPNSWKYIKNTCADFFFYKNINGNTIQRTRSIYTMQTHKHADRQ